MLVAHAFNPRYFGGWDPEDLGLRLAQTNSLWDPIVKRTRANGLEALESQFCKHEAQSR
jgi:hypothetical protein